MIQNNKHVRESQTCYHSVSCIEMSFSASRHIFAYWETLLPPYPATDGNLSWSGNPASWYWYRYIDDDNRIRPGYPGKNRGSPGIFAAASPSLQPHGLHPAKQNPCKKDRKC